MKILVAVLLALQDPAPFNQENSPANLKLLFERLQKAIAAGDEAAALALTNGLIPDAAALKKGLKDGLAPETLAQYAEFYAKILPAEPAKRAQLFKADPAATEVRVFAATTEELQKYETGSTAFM